MNITLRVSRNKLLQFLFHGPVSLELDQPETTLPIRMDFESLRLEQTKDTQGTVALTFVTERQTNKARATTLLLEMLGTGTKRAVDVKAEARQLGISLDMLTQAKRKLGVVSVCNQKRDWEWSLPKQGAK